MYRYFNKYLSFEGRLGRQQYIIRNIIIFFANAVTFFFMGLAATSKSATVSGLTYLVAILIFLFLTIASVANIVRRWQDLDRPRGTGILVGLLPVGIGIAIQTNSEFLLAILSLIFLYPAIILLFQKGTIGDNKYGPDPLQATEPVASQPIYNNRPVEYGKKVQKVYGIASVDSSPRQQTSVTLQPRQQPVSAVPTSQQQSSINFNDLRELKKLLDEGVITQEEFAAAKKKILG